MRKIIGITLASIGIFGVGLILAILTYPLFKPDIVLTIDAPKMSEDKAAEIGAVKLQTDSCAVTCTSPDGRYEIGYQGVDDRGWIEKLVGLSFSGNGLTQITVKDKTNQTQPTKVGTFLETDPGSGRSYSVALSENGQYLTISGAIRAERGVDAPRIDISYIFVINEGKLYSR